MLMPVQKVKNYIFILAFFFPLQQNFVQCEKIYIKYKINEINTRVQALFVSSEETPISLPKVLNAFSLKMLLLNC